MPITFTVDHARRLVIVIATGTVTRDTVVSYFDTQRRLEGLTYPRLVECRELDVRLTNDDWREVTAWLRTMVQGRTIGPAAVVVDSEQGRQLVRMIALLVSDICVIEPFADRVSAEEWLTELLAMRSTGWILDDKP